MSGKVIQFPVGGRAGITTGSTSENLALDLLVKIKEALETLGAKRVRITVQVENVDDEEP